MNNKNILHCNNVVELRNVIFIRTAKNDITEKAIQLLEAAKGWEKPDDLILLSEILLNTIDELNEDFVDAELFKRLLVEIKSYNKSLDKRNYHHSFKKGVLKYITNEIHELIDNTEYVMDEYELDGEDYDDSSHLDWIENQA